MIVSYTGRGKSLCNAQSVRLIGEACGGLACIECLTKGGKVRRIAVKPSNLLALPSLFEEDIARALLRLKEIDRDKR